VILFASHDQEFVSTVANRVIEITQEGGAVDRTMDFEDELERQGYLAEAV
jgi:ATPase subunit of ABC transporter with duplicated ATPase domains